MRICAGSPAGPSVNRCLTVSKPFPSARIASYPSGTTSSLPIGLSFHCCSHNRSALSFPKLLPFHTCPRYVNTPALRSPTIRWFGSNSSSVSRYDSPSSRSDTSATAAAKVLWNGIRTLFTSDSPASFLAMIRTASAAVLASSLAP